MDVYQTITDRIIAELEKGFIPWQKPWVGSGACIKHASGHPYSLLNQILLGKPGEWLSYRQAQAEGGQVKKGEKGRIVVFWKPLQEKDDNGNLVFDDNGNPKTFMYLSYSTVFHIDQCEGVSPKWDKELPRHAESQAEADALVDGYVTREGITLHKVKGDRAFYRPSDDSVTLPLIEQFKDVAEYYSTAFHELTHSTGHSTRLNRLEKATYFGSGDYSREELVAEMGASMLLNHIGLETPSSFKNNAAYIQNWLGALRGDKRFVVTAAGAAEKAVNYIIGKEHES